MRRISSRSNPFVTRCRDVARGRGPDGVILLDGEHLVEEALASGITLETVAFVDSAVDAFSDGLVDRLARAGAEVVRVPAQVMAALSPVRQPSGIVALARVKSSSLDDALAQAPQLVLLLNGIQDAGNVGAIVRAADGCGATGVIAADGTADPFGWKALRGAMGSTFRLPIAARQSAPAAVEPLQEPRHHRRRHRAAAGHAAAGVPLSRARRHTARRRGCWSPGRAGGRRRRAALDSHASARRIVQRRHHRRVDSLRSSETARWTCPCLTRPVRRDPRPDPRPDQRSERASSPRRTDAPADARRIHRSGGSPRRGPSAATGHRGRSAAIDHPLGTTWHRKDDAGAGHRAGDTRKVRGVQRGALGDQGNPDGHGRGRGRPPPARTAHHPLHRRNPSLQQVAAGRVSPARRGRRYRPHRRDDRESLVRSELGAALAVEGLRPQAAVGRRGAPDPLARRNRPRPRAGRPGVVDR